MNRHSLKYRIAIIVFLFEAVTVGLVLRQFRNVSFEIVRAQLEADNHSLLLTMDAPCRFAIINNDYGELQPYLEHVQQHQAVKRVYLSDYTGTIVATSEPGTLGKHLPALHDSADNHWFRQELENQAGPLGTLAVQFSDEALLRAHETAQRQAYVTAGIIMIFLTLVIIAIAYLATRRLERLAAAAEAVAHGNFDILADDRGSDEISLLAKSFNNMTRQIKSLLEERRQAEKVLQNSRRLLAETEKIGQVGGWEFNIDTGQQTWTEETYIIHEVDTAYEPTVDKGINFYTPASRIIIERAVRRAIDHGESFDLELEIITAKGNIRSVHTIGKADIENRRVYGFFQDISTRKKAEEEKEKLIRELQQALNEIKTLRGIIPICSYCKKIRNDQGAWDIMEAYITKHTDAEFSHSACPDCFNKQMAELDREV